MTVARRPLIAGNWKMNGLRASRAEFGRMLDGAKTVRRADLAGLPAGDAGCPTRRGGEGAPL